MWGGRAGGGGAATTSTTRGRQRGARQPDITNRRTPTPGPRGTCRSLMVLSSMEPKTRGCRLKGPITSVSSRAAWGLLLPGPPGGACVESAFLARPDLPHLNLGGGCWGACVYNKHGVSAPDRNHLTVLSPALPHPPQLTPPPHRGCPTPLRTAPCAMAHPSHGLPPTSTGLNPNSAPSVAWFLFHP